MNVTPKCDNTSVGILVLGNRGKSLLLINRKKPPFGLAAPAGHVDHHGDPNDPIDKRFEQAALNELEEETGLRAGTLVLWAEGRKENPCRRPGGKWHYWKIYIAADVSGELQPSKSETKGHFWCNEVQLRHLLIGRSLPLNGEKVALEPVWREWFLKRSVLSLFAP